LEFLLFFYLFYSNSFTCYSIFYCIFSLTRFWYSSLCLFSDFFNSNYLSSSFFNIFYLYYACYIEFKNFYFFYSSKYYEFYFKIYKFKLKLEIITYCDKITIYTRWKDNYQINYIAYKIKRSIISRLII
jgi:hypothetical protein